MLQLVFISRRGDAQVRNKVQIGEVKSPLMRFAIITDDAAAVDGKNNGQVLQADVMYNLVESTL